MPDPITEAVSEGMLVTKRIARNVLIAMPVLLALGVGIGWLIWGGD